MDKLQSIRKEFPVTGQKFIAPDGSPRRVIYLDHGASTHPPRAVLDHYYDFLERYYANIHRGRHYLSQKASDLFDEVIQIVADFIGADLEGQEVIFTANTTSAIDIAAHVMSWCDGATIVTEMEHHSNDLPHRRRGEVLRAHVLPDGTLDYEEIERLLTNHRVKLVAVTGASNVTGYLTDIHRIARMAHAHGARILVDGAQLLAHRSVNLNPAGDPDSRIDFFAAAGHKAYAPFGSAFLVAPRDVCDRAEPYIPGGGTVELVSNQDAEYYHGHERHSGGTPNIPGVIALGKALRWLGEIGMDWVESHERELGRRLLEGIAAIPGVRLLGNIPPEDRLGVATFVVNGFHHSVVSTILNNRYGIATRNGCFCAHPYMAKLFGCIDNDALIRAIRSGEEVDPPGGTRASLGIFNNEEDVDVFLRALAEIAEHVEWGSEASQSEELRCYDFA